MTRPYLIAAIILLACGAATAQEISAGPTLTITNPDIYAQPGGSASWFFSLYNDANYLVVNDAYFGDLTPLGFPPDYGFFPLINQSGHAVGPDETWTGAFGRYWIDPGTPLGASSVGNFTIIYDLYSGPPSGDTFLSSGNELLAVGNGGSITASPIPEPISVSLAALGLCALCWRRASVARQK